MIGGNIIAQIQVKSTIKNEIGEDVEIWSLADELSGFLDLLIKGEWQSNRYATKLEESSHIFICDYKPLVYEDSSGNSSKITPENSRFMINGEVYEVQLYDNPMQLNEHLEIYLKYLGGG